ncbi:MAG: ATP-binding protein [Limisphaerales bacterium]
MTIRHLWTLRDGFFAYTPGMVDLKKSKLFTGLLAEELQALEQTAQVKAFSAGQQVFKEGDPGDGIYLIIEGTVQISSIIGQDERRVLSQLGPGEFFGEMAVLDNEPRSATVSAETDTRVYFIPRNYLLNMLEHSPMLAASLVREFSLRLREFNRHYIREVLQSERLALVGRFARSIVHDFKNPLAIISFASDMIGADATQDLQQLAQKRIRRQVDRLSNMINELLEFTRGSQSSVVLGQADYGVFVEQLVEEIRPEATEKLVTLECQNLPKALMLQLDPRRLPHVFYNLIHNAIDAMPDGGKITIRCCVTESEVVTELEDTGKGIAPEIAGRLFEPFATYGKSSGTGLGLSICKRIIEDHRGKIQARTEPGRGAVFSFSLPAPW